MSNFLWGCSQLTNMGNMLPSEQSEAAHLSHNVWVPCPCLIPPSCLKYVMHKLFQLYWKYLNFINYKRGRNRKYCAPLALLLWKLKRSIVDQDENTLKGVWWSVRCAETEAHVSGSHAALLVAIPQPWFEPSRRPQLCFHTADLLTCRIAQLRIHFSPVCLQEHESATGPGWELRAGPDLHHGEDHFRLLPQQRGRAELCSQPAGGRLHAALQTRPKLPGVCFLWVHWE